jgi:metal-responsive CopG/Arc/MetJ family transcriptional regulator
MKVPPLPRKGYTSISIPDDMVKEIDRIVNQKKHGYSSRADLIADAVRRLTETLKPLGR